MARDLVVVGGGITGLSLAVHAARRGLETTLVEAGPLGGVATQRSAALVHTHRADQRVARLALRGLEHFETFEERYGGPSGFTVTGFAYVPSPDEIAGGALRARMRMLTGEGVETRLLTGEELREIDPALEVAGSVVYEPRSGYADPATVTATLAAAASREGVDVREHEPVEELLTGAIRTMPGSTHFNPGAVRGVRLQSGEELLAETTVLCAGAWSAGLAAAADVELPVAPAAVRMAAFAREPESHLAVIDAREGIAFRPEEVGATLVWRTGPGDEPLDSPNAELPDVDEAFAAGLRDRLATRLPSAAEAEPVGAVTGLLDVTPDGLPIVGPTRTPGLWICCGWSDSGFELATAVGDALATWLKVRRRPPELAPFSPLRPLRAPADARPTLTLR